MVMKKMFRRIIYLIIITIIIAIWLPTIIKHEKIDIGQVYLPESVIGEKRKKENPVKLFKEKDPDTLKLMKESLGSDDDINRFNRNFFMDTTVVTPPRIDTTITDTLVLSEPIFMDEPTAGAIPTKEKVSFWIEAFREIITHLNELITLILGLIAIKTYRKSDKKEDEEKAELLGGSIYGAV